MTKSQKTAKTTKTAALPDESVEPVVPDESAAKRPRAKTVKTSAWFKDQALSNFSVSTWAKMPSAIQRPAGMDTNDQTLIDYASSDNDSPHGCVSIDQMQSIWPLSDSNSHDGLPVINKYAVYLNSLSKFGIGWFTFYSVKHDTVLIRLLSWENLAVFESLEFSHVDPVRGRSKGRPKNVATVNYDVIVERIRENPEAKDMILSCFASDVDKQNILRLLQTD